MTPLPRLIPGETIQVWRAMDRSEISFIKREIIRLPGLICCGLAFCSRIGRRSLNSLTGHRLLAGIRAREVGSVIIYK
jgi:hypothetical protein